MKKIVLVLLTAVLALNMVLISPNSSSAASAGLAWGPKYVGNVKLYLTNVHKGWAGPKFPSKNTYHSNFHVDKKVSGMYKGVANYHIVKYKKNGYSCVYIYESYKKKTVMDSCSTSWKALAEKSAGAMKSFVKSALDYTNFLSLLAMWAVATLAIVDMIVPGDSIPILPNYVPETPAQDDIIYTESYFINEPQPPNDTTGFDPSQEINPETFTDGGITGPALVTDLPITDEIPYTGSSSGGEVTPPTTDPVPPAQPGLPGIPLPGDPTVRQ